MDDVDLEQARARIRERSELNAFISVSDEQGARDAVAVKDLVDVQGMVTTAGGVILPDVPASVCGVAGFKPAFGSIDLGGVIPLSTSLDTLGPMALDMAGTARAYSIMSGEDVSLASLPRPRLAVPARWVTGLDQPTSEAWGSVSRGMPEIEFGDRDTFFQVGLTILLFEAAAYHRRWATDSPEKYGEDVLRLIRRGFEVTPASYEQALLERTRLQDEAERAMEGLDALILPATAIVAPPIASSHVVRDPLSRF